MKRDVHPWGDCQSCYAHELLLQNFEILEEILKAEELTAFLSFPAVHLGYVDKLMGIDLAEGAKDSFTDDKLLQKSIVSVMQCAKEYASDVTVQVTCGFVLYATSIQGDKFMQLLWSEGACYVILAALDILVRGKAPRKSTQRSMLAILLRGLCRMYTSSMHNSEIAPPESGHMPRLPAVLSAMNILMDFEGALKDAMFALSGACSDCAENRALVGHSGIEIILSAMKRYPQDDHLQCNAFAALSHVCNGEQKNILYVAKDGVLRMLEGIAEVHANSVTVQASVTQLYSVIGSLECLEIKKLLVTAGCTRRVVHGMLRYKDLVIEQNVSDLMTSGISALSRIIDTALPHEHKTRAVAEGAGEAVIYVMSVRKDMNSQHLGLAVLQALILHHPENMDTLGFAALSAALGVLRVMKPEHAFIQHLACPVIHQIMAHACERLSHSECATVRNPGKIGHAGLVKNARGHQDEFACCGGVALFMNVMRMSLKCQDLGADQLRGVLGDNTCIPTDGLPAACATIPLVVFNHRENQDRFGEEALRLLQRVFYMHTTDTQVQTHARAAIRALAENNAENTTVCTRMGSSMEHILRCESGVHCGHDDETDRLRAPAQTDRLHAQVQTDRLRAQAQGVACKEREADVLRRGQQQQQAAACVACGKTAEMLGVDKLLHCSACTLAPCYCSVECQRACWKEHKAECKANKKKP